MFPCPSSCIALQRTENETMLLSCQAWDHIGTLKHTNQDSHTKPLLSEVSRIVDKIGRQQRSCTWLVKRNLALRAATQVMHPSLQHPGSQRLQQCDASTNYICKRHVYIDRAFTSPRNCLHTDYIPCLFILLCFVFTGSWGPSGCPKETVDASFRFASRLLSFFQTVTDTQKRLAL